MSGGLENGQYMPTCQTVAEAEDYAKDFDDPLPGRVFKGAERLDKNMPGWYRKIDKTKLNMSLCFACVIGQLFLGDYTNGLVSLGIYGKSEEFGFDLDTDERRFTSGRDKKMKRLTALWVKQIDLRLAKDN